MKQIIDKIMREFDKKFEARWFYGNYDDGAIRQFLSTAIKGAVKEALKKVELEEKGCKVYIFDSMGNKIGEQKAGKEYQYTLNGYHKARQKQLKNHKEVLGEKT